MRLARVGPHTATRALIGNGVHDSDVVTRHVINVASQLEDNGVHRQRPVPTVLERIKHPTRRDQQVPLNLTGTRDSLAREILLEVVGDALVDGAQ